MVGFVPFHPRSSPGDQRKSTSKLLINRFYYESVLFIEHGGEFCCAGGDKEDSVFSVQCNFHIANRYPDEVQLQFILLVKMSYDEMDYPSYAACEFV